MKKFLQLTVSRSCFVVGFVMSMLFFAVRTDGQVSLNSGSPSYFQNFDGLGTSTIVPWVDNSTLAGWYINHSGGSQLTTAGLVIDNGTLATGNSLNYGTTSAGDRALGAISSGTPANITYGVRIVNNDGSKYITSVTISYVGEQWRDGGNASGAIQTDTFQYAINPLSIASGSYTTVSALNFASPIHAASTTPVVLNGNSTANRVVLSTTITGIAVPPGGELWLRIKDINDAGNDHGLGIDSFTAAATFTSTPFTAALTNYYSKSSGPLTTLSTWTTDSTGAGGSSPSNFTTANQVFNIRNGNSGSLGSAWTVSGTNSRIVVDQTDFTYPSGSNTITGIIDVRAGRTLTIQNATQPTLGVLDWTSTVNYSGLSFSSSPTIPASAVYGNLTFTNTPVAIPTGSIDLHYMGNFTLSSSNFIGGDITATTNGYNLIAKGTGNQTINAGGNRLVVRNFNCNDGGAKSGTLSLNSGNTNVTVTNSVVINNTGSGNQFSDGGNNIVSYNNFSMGGNSSGYNLTGTMIDSAYTGAASKFRGYVSGAANDAAAAVPTFNNIIIATTGTGTVAFLPASGGAVNIGGSLTVASSGGTGAITLNTNTINVGGNFTHAPTTNRITFTGSTINFNGTSTQTYSTGVALGHTFINMTMNNSTGLNLSSPLTVSGTLTLTSGKIRTGSNTLALTSTTAVVSGGSSTSYVNGALSKVVPAAGVTSMLFEVGDTTYSPVRFGLNASATAGTIKVRSTYGSHPSIGSSAVNTSAMVNRYWTVNLSGVTAGAFPTNDSFSYATGDIIGGSNSGFTVRKYNNTSASWSSAGSTVNLTSTGGLLMGNASVAMAEPTNTVTMDYVAGQVIVINPPTITTVSPNTGISGSGGSGTAVTITGTNFNTTGSNNKVYFGATKAIVSSITGSTILNVNVPIGATYATVSVTDTTTGLSAYYNPPFKPTFNNAAFITDSINIKPKVDFNSTSLTGSLPFGGAIGDIDGDGKSDMVVNNSDSQSVSIFLNTSSGGTINSGSFSLYTKINISSKPNYVKLADLDGDGKLDIVCALSNSNNIAVVRNTTTTTGSPTFGSVTAIAVGSVNKVAALADFDGDGKIDVALSLNPAAALVGILRNTSSVGSISFGAVSTVTTGTTPNGIAVADFNGDGLPDLISGNFTTNNASVFQNTSTSGSISFSSAVTLTTGAAPIDMQTADIDADGKMDIIFTNSTDATFSVIRNIHTSGALAGGSFAGRVNFTTGTTPTGLNVADLNGDGKLDVVVANGASTSISVFRNTTTGSTPTFMPKVDYTTGSGPTTVTLGDLDGDTYSDIVVGNQNDRTVSVFETYPLPYITPITGTDSVCVAATTTFADSVTGGTWSSSNTSQATVDPSTGVITGVAAGTPLITYTVISGGDTNYVTRTVTVRALPTGGTITGTTTVCPTTTSTLSNTTFTGGTGAWSSSAAAIATVDPTTGVVTGVSLGSAIITFTVTSASGCGTATDTAIVNVTSSPSAGTITGTTTVCTGSSTTLSSGVSGGTWSSSASGVATVDPSTGVVTGVTAGSATITYTVTSACGTASATASYTVNTVPATPAAITGTTTFCVSTTSTLSDTTAGGTWSSSASGVATVDPTTGVVTGVTAGSATISYTVTNSCGSTSVTTSVTINGLPAAPAAITGTTTLCSSDTTTLADATSGGTWSSTATGVATIDPSTGFVTAVSVGTSTISYTVTNACGSTATTTTFTVITTPSTPASITGTTTVCTSATTTLASTTGGGTWSSSASGIATVDPTTGVVTGVTVGSATITYTVSNACGSASTTTTVTVITTPATPASITGTTTVAVSATTTLSSTTGGGTWSSSATSIATISSGGVVTGVSAGSATITYTVTNSCGSSFVTTSVTVTSPTYVRGNLVVLKDNSTASSAASSISLLEYNTTTPNQSSAVSTLNYASTGSSPRLVVSGTATSEGQMSLDSERTHLIVCGYDTVAGVTSVVSAGVVRRAISSVDPSITSTFVSNVTQSFAFSGNNIRGATAAGSKYYATGTSSVLATGGIQIMGATTSQRVTATATTAANTRVVQVFNGQLYYSTATGTTGIFAAGSGIRTDTGNTATILTTSGTAFTSPYGFAISPDNNTLYVADDAASTGGLFKYTRTGGTGTFAFAYKVTTIPCRGLTVDFTTTPFKLYGTTTATSANALIRGTDNGASSTFDTLATAPSATAFRGVAFTPNAYAKISATTATVCSGTTDTLIVYGNPGDTVNYTANGSATFAVMDATGRKLVSSTYTNSTSSPVTNTYALVSVVTSVGTVSISGTTTITVNPIPVVPAITGTTTVCVAATTTLADTATGGTWTSATPAVATISSGGVVTGVSAGTAVISYSKTNAFSCGPVVVTTTVTVNPLPVVGAITGTTTICTSTSTTLADTSAGGTWSSSASGVATVDPSTGVVTGVTAGSATISYTVTNSCGSISATTAFTVTTTPSTPAAITGTTTICTSATSTLTSTTAGGVWSSSASGIATVDPSTGVVTGVTVGSANITYTVTNSCGTSFVTTSVTIITTPSTPASITGTTTVCTSAASTLSSTTGGGAWSSSDGAVATIDPTTGVVTGVTVGSATITYTVTNACGSAFTTTGVTINTTPATPGAITGTTTVCTSATTTLADTTAGGTWSSSASGIATVNPSTGVVTGVTAGSATITYTVTNACGSSFATTAVTVNTVPATPPAITGTTSVSTGLTTTLSNTTGGGTWSSSATGVATVNSSTGVVFGVSAGSATITYTVTNSCGSAFVTTSVTVSNAFTAGNLVVYMVNDTLSSAAAVSLREYTTTGSVVNTITLPSSGTGRIVSSGSASSEGMLSLDAERNHIILSGYDTSAGFASVAGAANISRKLYSIAPNTTGTEVRNLSQTFVFSGNNIRSATANGTNYYGSGNGTTATGGVQLMAASSSTKITATAQVITNARNVQIFNGQLYVGTGSSPAGIYAVGTGVPTANSASTRIHSGGLGNSPYGFSISPDSNTLYVIDDSATVGIKKFTRTGGAGTFSYAYTVTNRLGRGLTVDYTTTPYTIYAVTVESGNAPDSIIKVTDNGAGSAYTAIAGTQRGKLFRGITFAPVNNATLKVATATVCAGASDTVFFYGNPGDSVNYTVNGSAAAFRFDASGWKRINTGALSTTTTYALVNIVTSMGTTSLSGSATITVNSAPTVPAITGTTTVCVAATTTLADTATGGTWTSATPSVATISAGGIVTGVSAGTSVISYAKTNSCGTTTVTTTLTVNPLPSTPSPIAGTTTVCVSATTTLTDTAAGGTWSSTTPSVATISTSGVVTGVAVGTTTISYVITNSCGTTFATTNVTVNDVPVVGAISGTTTVCTGLTTTLSDTTSGGTWSSSASGVATVNPSTGVVYGVTAGSATISYTVTNACGSTSQTAAVTVNTSPVVGPILGATAVCETGSIALSDTTSGGTWSSSNPSLATVSTTGTVYGLVAGSVTISYGVTSSCGTVYATSAITVNSSPTIGAISGATHVCISSSVTLSDTTAGGTWSSTTPSIATIDPSTGVLYGVSAGIVTISYSIGTLCGTFAVTYTDTVLGTPSVASITGVTPIIAGQIITAADATSGGIWTSSSTTVATISSTGVITGLSVGSSTISYTVTNACASTTVTASLAVNTSFGAGNIVVYRVNGTSNGANPITLASYTPAGAASDSITLPSTGSSMGSRIVTSGSSTSEGGMSLDSERVVLCIPGYDTTTAVTASLTSTANNVRREIYTVNAALTATSVASVPAASAYQNNNFRSATGAGGRYYGAGTGGTGNNGILNMNGGSASQLSTTVTNTRHIGIYNGQLYFSTGSGTIGVYQVGSGIPTGTGVTSTLVAAGPGAYGFAINPSDDTMYMANDAGTGYGIRKYYKSGGTWTFAYILDTFASRGLAVDFTTKPYTVYATTAYSPGNQIIKVVDNGAGSSRTVIATAGATQNFRGVALSPKPSAKIVVTTSLVCSGTVDSVIIYGNPGATVNYTEDGSATSTTIPATGRRILSSTYTNATGAPITHTYALVNIVTSVGTFIATGSGTITVNPALSATITGTATICSGSSTSISVTGGTPAAVITLSPGGATFTLDGSGNGSVAVSPSATTTYTATVTYSICTVAATGSVVKTVNPLPTASISGTASIFAGSSTNITFTGTAGAKVYYTPDAGLTIDSVTLDTSGTFIRSVTPSSTTTYSLISVLSTAGCSNSASGSAVITVTTMPYANITGTTTICQGASTSLIITGTAGGTVHYTRGGVADSIIIGVSGSDTITISPTSTITYALVDIVSAGTTYTISGSATITVVPLIAAGTLSGTTSICVGDTTNIYTSTSAGGTWSTSASSVASVNAATGRVYAVSAGSATISYTVTNSCFTDVATRSVTINALPTASISGTTTIFLGSSYTVTFTGTASATVTYTVNGGSPLTITLSGAGSATITDTPSISKTYALVSVLSTAGCSNSASGSAVITVTQPFSRYNLVVNRLGDGSTTLNSNAARQSLVEYSTSGTATGVATTIPFSSGVMGTESGSATSGGQISLDSERTHVIVSGYNAAQGTASVASGAGIRRTVFSVLPSAVVTNVANVSQAFAYNSNNIRSATAAGTRYYAAGASTTPTLTGGIQLMSDTTSKQISRLPASNTRVVQIYNGQLYYATASATPIGVYKVGNGIPSDTANVATSMNPTTTGLNSPYAFSFSPDKKTLYIADDGSGIFKFTRSSDTGSFAFAYKVTATTSRSLVVDYTTSPYTIYAVTAAATTNNTIIKMSDTGATSATTTIASAGANYVFRGLTFAPSSYAKVKGTVATVCSGTADTVIVYGNPGATVNYTFNGTSSSVAIDGTGMNRLGLGTLTNTTPSPINVTFKITSVVTSLGTTTIADSTTITVNPLPYVPAITGAGDLCIGSSITVADTATYGTWSSSTPSVATISAAGVVSALSPGVDTIFYSETNSCGTTVVSAVINVNALPTAGSISVTPVSTCVGSLLTLSETGAASGTGTLSSYNWSGPSGYSHTGTASSDTVTAASTAFSGIYSLTVTYPGTGCTSSPVTSAAVTVNVAPTAYSVTGGGSYCGTSGLSIGLSNSDTGVSYQLYLGGIATGSPVTGTGSAISFGSSFTTTGTYTVTATGAGGCTPVAMTGSAIIADHSVGIVLGANPSVCQPTSSVTISYGSPSGSPATYGITWSSDAIADGFSNVSSATLGSTIPLTIPTGADTAYGLLVTVSNAYCTSPAYPATLTVYAHPTAAITSATSPCSGYATNIVFTGTPRAVISYTIDGGSTSTATLAAVTGVYSLSTGAITTPHIYRLLDAHNPVCSVSLSDSATVNPIPMHWVGGTSTDWNTASNWSCGFVPGATDNVTIDTGTANAPAISAAASGTTGNLILIQNAVITLNSGSTLNVKGDITNNGSVTGSGKLTLNGSSAQAIAGFGSVKNFTLANSAGATINTGSRLTVKSLLSITSGTLTTSDSLVMYSDASGTARVDSLPAGTSISGQAKVMIYVPGGRRVYRFWSHPFSNYIGLNQVERYIDVTGPGGASSGFTTTASNAPSAFRYTPLSGNSSLSSDPGWRQFANAGTATDSNRIHQYQGIRLFFRGAKDEGLYYATGYTPSAVTVAQWGNLNQGTQTVPLAKGTSAFQEYNMVGNPYASPVDIGTVVYNAYMAGNIVGPAYFVWNPTIGAAGQYVAQFITTATAVPYYLQSCNSFQVRAAYNGATLSFSESNKGANATANLFRTAPEYVSLKVYDANYHPYDMLYVQFNDKSTDNDDSAMDAAKPFAGADLNFYSISKDKHKMTIDSRPYDADKVIPLGLTAQYSQDYIIKAESVALPVGGQLYLHDKLLKQYVAMQPGAEYRFSVSNTAATQGDNRFELTMKPAELTPAFEALKVAMTPNPATEEVQIGFTQGKAEQMAVRLLDLSGVSIYNRNLGIQQNGSVTIPLSKLASGIYMVELTSGDAKVVQRLIKE